MAILNFSKQFIFVHIPKTGGSSVTRMLSSYTQVGDLEIGGTPFGEGIAPFYEKRFQLKKHSTAQEIQGLLGMEKYQSMWSFATVRNPYFRALSLFRFLKQWGGGPYRNKIDRIKTFEEFVHSTLLDHHPLARPQSYWLSNEADEILVNDWFALENLSKSLPTINTHLGLPKNALHLVHVNESSKFNQDMLELSLPHVQQRIRNQYLADFHHFQYPEVIQINDIQQSFSRQTSWWFKFKYSFFKPKEWL